MIKLTELLSMNAPISDKLRIHWSKEPIRILKSTVQENRPMNKPWGLWYGFGREWIDFVYGNEISSKHGNYIYYVKIKDFSKTLQIKNREEITQFSDKFGSGRGLINWRNVSQQYNGIEINPWLGNLYRDDVKFSWYGDWSIASGCIWTSEFVELKQIYPKKNEY